jgi:hypothetical protein
VGVQLGTLGLHSSNTYHVSREPSTLPVLLGNSFAVTGGCGLVALVAYAVLQSHPELAPVTGPLLALAFAAIPIGLAYLLLQNLLIGTQRVRTYNVIDLTTRVLAVGLVAATAPLGIVSPEPSRLVLATSSSASSGRSPSWDRCAADECGVGRDPASRPPHRLRAYQNLFSFLVLKSDVLVVTYLRGTETRLRDRRRSRTSFHVPGGGQDAVVPAVGARDGAQPGR